MSVDADSHSRSERHRRESAVKKSFTFLTGFPFKDSMMSPAANPASCAGPPSKTWLTRTAPGWASSTYASTRLASPVRRCASA